MNESSKKKIFYNLLGAQLCFFVLASICFSNIQPNIVPNEKALINTLSQRLLLQKPSGQGTWKRSTKMPKCQNGKMPPKGGQALPSNKAKLLCNTSTPSKFERPAKISCLLCSTSFLCISPSAACISNRRTNPPSRTSLMPIWHLRVASNCSNPYVYLCH